MMIARSPRAAFWRKTAGLAGVTLALSAVFLLAWLLISRLEQPPGLPRAAIVDQLSLTFPNPEFVEAATETLERAGYAADYYAGEEVTVDFYRHLPERDYELLIMRTHAALTEVDDNLTEEAGLFTSEQYDFEAHVDDQIMGRLNITYYGRGDLERGEDGFFSIPPVFVESSMRGRFDGAQVILMGCNVLTGEALANAFLDKGADTVVGWNDYVSASHTDTATLSVLEHLLDNGLPLEMAAGAAMTEVGPDPYYDAELVSLSRDGQ